MDRNITNLNSNTIERKYGEKIGELMSELYQTEIGLELSNAVADYYCTLALRLRQIVNAERFKAIALQSLLPVFKALGEDETLMQNVVEDVHKKCGFRSYEWDDYIASYRARYRRKQDKDILF